VSAEQSKEILRKVQEDGSYRPRQSPQVVVRKTPGSDVPFVLRSKTTGEYYNVDFLTVAIWRLVDGEHTIDEIVDTAKKSYWREIQNIYSSELPEKAIRDIVLFFASEGLLAGTEPVTAWKRLRFVSAFELDYTITLEGTQFFKRLGSLFEPFTSAAGVGAILEPIIVGGLFLAPAFLPILFNRANFEVFGSAIVGFFFYYLLFFPFVVVHEIAHGATLAHYGGLPGEVGTGLYFFGPMFYVDTSDSWALPRRQRIWVSLSGPISTLLLGSFLVFVNLIWPSQTVKMMSFFCFYWMFWNLIPLIETDGYYALMDIVGIPNLRKQAFSYLKSKLSRNASEDLDEVAQKKHGFLMGYSLFSVAFMFVLAYNTYVILQYMASDALAAVLRILQGTEGSALAIDLASFAYFGLTVVGLITLPISLIRRRRKEGGPE
jgi:putative peptide zinc metalloprotease protein